MFRTLTLAAIVAVAPVTAASAQMMSGKTYVMKAGASDLYEMQSSRLLLSSTGDAKLKNYANMMIRDHTKSTDEVKAAAKQAGMTVAPPKLDAKQSRDVAALRAAKGTARDQLYVRQQKASHQMALKLQQDYAANGTVQALKAAAGQIVPVVQMHITDLQGM